MSGPLRIATYNIEWFASLFDENGALRLDDGWSSRRDVTRAMQGEAVAAAIRAVDPDLLLVVEGPDETKPGTTTAALQGFAAHFGLRQTGALSGFANGTQQELALMFDPARVTARHDPKGAPFRPPSSGRRLRLDRLGPAARAPRFDSVLPLDIDEDGLVDLHEFSKPPLEAEVVLDGAVTLRLIGVHAKSKAPHGAKSARDAIRLQIRNRRKQLAQCEWIRRRVDGHLDNDEPVIVLGDLNDGPGLDRYEKLFGRSGVEVVVGDVSAPDRLLRNPHIKARLDPDLGWRPATARFYDRNRKRYLNALIDFILLSPDLVARGRPDWRIWHPFDDPDCYGDADLRKALLTASDHFPVSVDLAFR